MLVLLAEGRSNKEVAAALFISEKTASVHVSHILAKLGVRSRVQAVAVAHRVGLPGREARSLPGGAGPGVLEPLAFETGLHLAAADGPHTGVPADDGRVVARGPDGGRRGERRIASQ